MIYLYIMDKCTADKVNQLCCKIKKLSARIDRLQGGGSTCLDVTLPLNENSTAGELMAVAPINGRAVLVPFYKEVSIDTQQLWLNSFNADSSGIRINNISTDPDGNLYVIGIFEEPDTITELPPIDILQNATTSQPAFVAKLDKNTGQAVWLKILDTDTSGVGYDNASVSILKGTTLYAIIRVASVGGLGLPPASVTLIYDNNNIETFSTTLFSQLLLFLSIDITTGSLLASEILLSSTGSSFGFAESSDQDKICNTLILNNANDNLVFCFQYSGGTIASAGITATTIPQLVILQFASDLDIIGGLTYQLGGINVNITTGALIQDNSGNFYLSIKLSQINPAPIAKITFSPLPMITLTNATNNDGLIVKFNSALTPISQLQFKLPTLTSAEQSAIVSIMQYTNGKLYLKLSSLGFVDIDGLGEIKSLQYAPIGNFDISRNSIIILDDNLTSIEKIVSIDNGVSISATIDECSGFYFATGMSLSTSFVFVSGIVAGISFTLNGRVIDGQGAISAMGFDFNNTILKFNLDLVLQETIPITCFEAPLNILSESGSYIKALNDFEILSVARVAMDTLFFDGTNITFGESSYAFAKYLSGMSQITIVNPQAENTGIIGSLDKSGSQGSNGTICVNGVITVPEALQPLTVGSVYYLDYNIRLGFTTNVTDRKAFYALTSDTAFLFGPGSY